MRQDGFTLVEMLVVVTIIGILLTTATIAFNHMMTKSAIEAQAKEIYADLMTARTEALFQKSDRSVKLTTSTQLSVYPTRDGSGAPILQKNFKQPIASNFTDPLSFDANGVSNRGVPPDLRQALCVGPSGNPAAADSIIISTTSIMLGKLTGGTCDGASVEAN